MRAPAKSSPKFFPLSTDHRISRRASDPCWLSWICEGALTSCILVGCRGFDYSSNYGNTDPSQDRLCWIFTGVAKRQQSPYFYVISVGDEDEPSSLCHLCGLSDEDFNGLLIAAGLATYDTTNDKLIIRHNQWGAFIDNYAYQMSSRRFIKKIEPTKFDLQSLYDGSLPNRKIRKKYHTLRVGNKAAGDPNNIQGQLDT